MRAPLLGIRVHLSGSIPEDATDEQVQSISSFVERFALAVLRDGGTLVHGSHPSFDIPLKAAAGRFVAGGGSRDALILVRAQKFATTSTQFHEIEAQRQYSTVQIVPAIVGDITRSLVPMREWMAEHSDVMVAIGGRHWEINRTLAGVPEEVEETLARGKPAFVLGGFGGAIMGYLEAHSTVFSRLRNGLTIDENRAIAANTDSAYLVDRIISQIQLLPLIRESVKGGRLFRILALDGGGLRGTFTAAVLAKWDDMLKSGGGNELVKHFDLVAGTSTGAILAIGLGLGLTPLQILEFYRVKGPQIFPKDRRLRHWIKSKHESLTLAAILAQVFGDKLIRESCCRLVIPTVRAIHGEAEAIVTPHSPDRTAFSDLSAVKAALASSAAPTYFDEAVVESSIAASSYLDGGIWANNPILPAIAEAVRHLKVPLGRIDVLSVGTTGNEVDFTESLSKGKVGWSHSSADLFFSAQQHGAGMLADSFLSPARHLRVNQQTPSEIKFDDKEAIDDMALRGHNVGQDSFLTVRSRFLDGFHATEWRQP
ncbi:MAG: patatin-like phospholipase family protein [Nitrospira sp.]|nr:patatin-like phospholipase family protein [Nitrospira sp.]